MKKLLSFTLFCCALATISSCSKSINDVPANQTATLARTGSQTARAASTPDVTSALTSHNWVYYEYFSNFSDPATTLVWKTNRTSNALNLARNVVHYNTDGTYWEYDQNGTYYYGTWSLLNNQTQVHVTNNAGGAFTSTIQLLDSSRYEWLDVAGSAYGVMVPQNQAIDTTGGRLQLLTSKTWVYKEYFTGFDQPVPSLVWKSNKANSTLNLAQNVVKFNTDGTYWEYDQNGIYYYGNWYFLNNQTQVQVHNNVGGTFTSIIQLLTTDRYEWLDINGNTYGEMTPQ